MSEKEELYLGMLDRALDRLKWCEEKLCIHAGFDRAEHARIVIADLETFIISQGKEPGYSEYDESIPDLGSM